MEPHEKSLDLIIRKNIKFGDISLARLGAKPRASCEAYGCEAGPKHYFRIHQQLNPWSSAKAD
jgi:hypothetical protein